MNEKKQKKNNKLEKTLKIRRKEVKKGGINKNSIDTIATKTTEEKKIIRAYKKFVARNYESND